MPNKTWDEIIQEFIKFWWGKDEKDITSMHTLGLITALKYWFKEHYEPPQDISSL